MADAIYLMCAATSVFCALLLFRGWRASQQRLLFWSALCFVGLALNNALLFADLVLMPDADLSVWDPGATKTITAKKQFSRVDYNVFEGYQCTGLPVVVLSRGRIAWKEGDLRAKAGDGDFVRRDPYPAVHVANSTWRETNRPRAVKRAGTVTP